MLFCLSFANAIFLPFGPEIAFFPILLVNHSKLAPYATYCVLGSVAGLMVTFFLSYHLGKKATARFISEEKIEQGMVLFAKYGNLALVVASMFPVFPYRILVVLAGVFKQKPLAVLILLVVGKSLRFFGYGFLIAKLGESVLKYLL